MLLKRTTTLLTLSIAAFCLSGCMSTNPYTGEQQVSNTTKGAGIGAASGALLGGLLGGGKGALIGAGVGTFTGSIVGNVKDRENDELRRQLTGSGVQVQKTTKGIDLVMDSDITFAFNSANIRSTMDAPLSSVAQILKKYRHNSIVISGYTDNTGSAEYNQELSEKRAQSVADYLIAQGVPASRIFVHGYGQRYPITTNKTDNGRAQNRRVVLTLRQQA